MRSGGLISYHGNKQRAIAPHHCFDQNDYKLGLRWVCRQVIHVQRVQVKQAMVQLGRYGYVQRVREKPS